jgi:hypothetical protein
MPSVKSQLQMFISRAVITNHWKRDRMVRNLKVISIETVNGEKHYVVRTLKRNENPVNSEDFDGANIRRTMKKEASEPLLLLREE